MLALLLMTNAACGGASPPPAADILIASDFPVSASDFSTQAVQAIQLAISQKDHINGFKLGYLSFDDFLGHAAFPPKGIQNVKAMIANAKVLGMIGPWTSNMAFAEIPVANPFDLAIVSPTNTNDCITRPNPGVCLPGEPPPQSLAHPNNYFRIASPDAFQGRALAQYISSLGVTRAAALNEFGAKGELVVKDFGDALARAGGKLLFTTPLDPTTRSFTGFLNSAKAAGAQAILAVGSQDDRICAARAQMTGILPKSALFLGYDGILGDQCVKDAGDNAAGMIVATSDVEPTPSSDAALVQAVADFRKAFPNTKDIQTYVLATYDSARILIDAIQRAVDANGGIKPTRLEVVKAMSQAHFEGATGTYSFDARGDALSPMMSICRVDNGQWVVQNKIEISTK
jgi:branched-chain amino acid transport system substrate-binding protein